MSEQPGLHDLTRGLSQLDHATAPPLHRVEALVREVRTREAARLKRELVTFLAAALGVTGLALAALARQPEAFLALQGVALAGAVLTGLVARQREAQP